MSFLVAPAAAAAAILAPFGLADPALEFMASALDMIAAVGATFGERPEAVRALPRPPDLAFVLCVVALLWASLWRGALRWLGAPILAASIALYVTAPQPVAAFDSDLRAIFARASDGDWLLINEARRSTYARDRLGAMLGLAPAQLERLAPPETCGDEFCTWEIDGQRFAYARTEAALAPLCEERSIILSRAPSPAGASCAAVQLIDANNLAEHGGGLVYLEDGAIRIERAWPSGVRRAWTPRTPEGDQE